jgi:YidC/Oxa1 family membrane protein insertase
LYGWTDSLFKSASDAHLFTAPISAQFGSSAKDLAAMQADGTMVKIIAGILVLIMMGTTYATSRQMILKTGWAEDPQQKMIQRLMLYGIPASLLISGSLFPIGVIIYWVTNNLFTLAQQQWVLRKFPPPPMAGKTTTPARPSGPPAKKPAAGRKPVSPVQPGRTGGLFSRKTPEPEPQSPVVDTKALGPKPGAKPVNPKKGARPASKPKG